MSELTVKTENKEASFVNYIIQRCASNKGTAAALRRADNPNTEYQSWEYLAPFVELDKSWLREPFALVAASIAKAKIEANGKTGIGQAISLCYSDGNVSDQAKAKLRRLLACDSVEEVCRILRPLLSLIESKSNATLDYSKLLQQLINFNWRQEWVKSQWAQDFYNKKTSVEANDSASEGGDL